MSVCLSIQISLTNYLIRCQGVDGDPYPPPFHSVGLHKLYLEASRGDTASVTKKFLSTLKPKIDYLNSGRPLTPITPFKIWGRFYRIVIYIGSEVLGTCSLIRWLKNLDFSCFKLKITTELISPNRKASHRPWVVLGYF